MGLYYLCIALEKMAQARSEGKDKSWMLVYEYHLRVAASWLRRDRQ